MHSSRCTPQSDSMQRAAQGCPAGVGAGHHARQDRRRRPGGADAAEQHYGRVVHGHKCGCACSSLLATARAAPCSATGKTPATADDLMLIADPDAAVRSLRADGCQRHTAGAHRPNEGRMAGLCCGALAPPCKTCSGLSLISRGHALPDWHISCNAVTQDTDPIVSRAGTNGLISTQVAH